MNDEEALEHLGNLIKDSEQLVDKQCYSTEHTRWLVNTTQLLEEIFGKGSRLFVSFFSIQWKFRGAFVAGADEYEFVKKVKDHEAYLDGLNMARGLFEAGKDLIKRKGIDNVHVPEKTSEIVKIISLIESKLRKLIRTKPTKEKEVNDALEDLFSISGLEYQREKIGIPYSSKTYVPDFVFEDIGTVVEGKLCDDNNREKAIISEINDDILAYKTRYPNQIFVVYDLGIIRDEDRFRKDIETQDQVILRIIKH